MISLKKYLDADAVSPYPSAPDADELLPVVLKAYLSVLLAIASVIT